MKNISSISCYFANKGESVGLGMNFFKLQTRSGVQKGGLNYREKQKIFRFLQADLPYVRGRGKGDSI